MMKNPISNLQEFTAKTKQPLPQYTITTSSTEFTCFCFVNVFKTEATASNKKEAKTLAAEKMCKLIMGSDNYSVNHTTIHTSPLLTTAIDSAIYNPVGKLNEFCSQNGYCYPDYTEQGKEVGMFKMGCLLNGQFTVGVASSKKAAKQNAALLMLEHIKKNKLPKVKTEPTFVKIPPEWDQHLTDKAVSQFKTHCSLSSLKQNSHHITDPFQSGLKSPTRSLKSPPDYTLDQLEKKLRNIGINYRLHELAPKPHTLMVTSDNGLAALEYGENYEKTKYTVLKTLLKLYEARATEDK